MSAVTRWFETEKQSAIVNQVSADIAELTKTFEGGTPGPPRRYKWIAAGIVAVLMLTFIAVIFIGLQFSSDQGGRSPMSQVVMTAVLTIGAGVAAFVVASMMDNRSVERWESFQNIAKARSEFKPLFNSEIPPRKFAQVFDEDGNMTCHAWATGRHQGIPFHWINVLHTYDPKMAEAKPPNELINSLAGGGKNKRITGRNLDMIVFPAPIPGVPDFVLCPFADAHRGYVNQALPGAPTVKMPELNNEGMLANKKQNVFAAVSDQRFVDRIVSPGLKSLVKRVRPVGIQVIGGYVVFYKRPIDNIIGYHRVYNEADLTEYLDDAVLAYQELKKVALARCTV